MARCIQLACNGSGNAAPNPLVGAVLVFKNRIIGEGYHQQYGLAHAEVNCINSVAENDLHLLQDSTLYVSLEPCSHFGKTPPCADLIIRKKIPQVVIGCTDSFKKVNGSGITKLKTAGVQVTVGVLEEQCRQLNKRFFTFHNDKRPFVILKWAQSSNYKIAGQNFQPVKISNEFTDRLVHKWRSEEAAILIGANTALCDNPSLTTRLWPGKNPLRILLDRNLMVEASNNIFNNASHTIIINDRINKTVGTNCFHKLPGDVKSVLDFLYEQSILSVIVEGGAKTIHAFVEAGCWDEARIITNADVQIDNGIAAPYLQNQKKTGELKSGNDTICFYENINR